MTRTKQRGVTFLGMLVVGGLMAMLSVLGMQVAPTVMEYLAVQRAATKATAGGTVPEVRALFDKTAQIENVKSIAGRDLDITKEGDRVVIGFAYQREIHLVGPAYLVLKYKGQVR